MRTTSPLQTPVKLQDGYFMVMRFKGIRNKMESIIEQVHKLGMRRVRLCKGSVHCPKCQTKQVQLIDWFSKIAKWKCRECKYAFWHEPLVTLWSKK